MHQRLDDARRPRQTAVVRELENLLLCAKKRVAGMRCRFKHTIAVPAKFYSKITYVAFYMKESLQIHSKKSRSAKNEEDRTPVGT